MYYLIDTSFPSPTSPPLTTDFHNNLHSHTNPNAYHSGPYHLVSPSRLNHCGTTYTQPPANNPVTAKPAPPPIEPNLSSPRHTYTRRTLSSHCLFSRGSSLDQST